MLCREWTLCDEMAGGGNAHATAHQNHALRWTSARSKHTPRSPPALDWCRPLWRQQDRGICVDPAVCKLPFGNLLVVLTLAIEKPWGGH